MLIFSGTVTLDGIDNLLNASVMLDNNGNSGSDYMEIGEGRKFMDGDNFSHKIGF